MKHTLSLVAAALCLTALLSGPVSAQERGEAHERGPGREHRMAMEAGPHALLDQRYHHDHYYPHRGSAVPVLPAGSLRIVHGSGSWYFHGGVWFRPSAGRYVVAVPPIGIFLPILPPDSVTLWIGGAPYYYANGVYYAPASNGYTVVAPPPGADAADALPVFPPPHPPAAAAAPAPEPIVYPRNGQSAAQTDNDRQDCQRWAAAQPSVATDGQVQQRAWAACMDGRGYTLR